MAVRVMWKAAVSFGLVSIMVKLFAATEEKDVRFNQVHRADGGRIRNRRMCSACGDEVSYDQIAKGYRLGGDEMIVLTDDDFAALPRSSNRVIDVLRFVPADQVDPILFDKAYYLEPEATAVKAYLLLREALLASDRVAIVRVAPRHREHLGTLRVRCGVLVLNTMLWPDEIRPADFRFLDEEVSVRPQELAMASSLIESMSADFKAEEFSDGYREALRRVIDARLAGRLLSPPRTSAADGAAIDLMTALRESIERAKANREADRAA